MNKRKSKATPRKRLMICVRNEGYAASLERFKVYVVLADDDAAAARLVRVMDESGEDYLYPEAYFAPVEVPGRVRSELLSRESAAT